MEESKKKVYENEKRKSAPGLSVAGDDGGDDQKLQQVDERGEDLEDIKLAPRDL